jgi:hypothetical protein
MPEISGPAGVEVDGISVFPLPQRQATRVTFLIEPGDSDVADLRVVLRDSDETGRSASVASPLDPRAGRRGLVTVLGVDLDLGPQGTMVGGHANAVTVEHLRR